MQFALLIYQDIERIVEGRSQSELAEIANEYAAITATPELSQNIPLGHSKDATTVRVQHGKTMTSEGTVAGPGATVASCYLFEAEDQGAAIDFAARFPAARLGGAIEVRPVGQYWQAVMLERLARVLRPPPVRPPRSSVKEMTGGTQIDS
jgi:hypothetical protein